ncbi:c-type cytochrome [Sphingomonas immobilis]|uniref:Cytochrome c n=1 Tax=Sphingomonas immobilis TaxID=3063997 RepID=A0ABT8ZT66_9SPHN|nr:cytochrome c [Sphingomonas sp. CA1-15]MDO7840734.1 cytochrome c [Sphingomonas sp. CA1-15]
MIPTRAFRPIHIAVLLSVGCAIAAPAAAPSPAAIVAARQAGFKKIGGAMKVLKDQLASGAPVKATMVAAAQTVAAGAKEQAKLFPAGSGASSGVKNDALPSVWSDRAAFDAAMQKFIVESGKLVTVANGGDAAAIGAQFKATGGTCGACHRQFRAEQ